MKAEAEIRFLGDVQRLELGPDDILVLKMPGRVTGEMADRIREHFAKLLGNERKIIILDNGCEIGVLTPTSEG